LILQFHDDLSMLTKAIDFTPSIHGPTSLHSLSMFRCSPRSFPRIAQKRRLICQPAHDDESRNSDDTSDEQIESPPEGSPGIHSQRPQRTTRFRLPFSFEADMMNPPIIDPPGHFDWMTDTAPQWGGADIGDFDW
jgi:hypothetical protein